MKRLILGFGALLIGIFTLLSQLFVSSDIIYGVIGLMPLGYAWIVQRDDFISPAREAYLFTVVSQLFFMTTLYLEPMFYGRMAQELYIIVVGPVSGGIIASVSLNSVMTPPIFAMAIFGVVEVALDDKLRDIVSG